VFLVALPHCDVDDDGIAVLVVIAVMVAVGVPCWVEEDIPMDIHSKVVDTDILQHFVEPPCTVEVERIDCNRVWDRMEDKRVVPRETPAWLLHWGATMVLSEALADRRNEVEEDLPVACCEKEA
jgi:hypothetical protein